jgi:hypothetical protein
VAGTARECACSCVRTVPMSADTGQYVQPHVVEWCGVGPFLHSPKLKSHAASMIIVHGGGHTTRAHALGTPPVMGWLAAAALAMVATTQAPPLPAVFDVAVYGATPGGIMAAIAARRS